MPNFEVSPDVLTQLVQNKMLEQHFASLDSLVEALETSTTKGICDSDSRLVERINFYGQNFIVPRSKNSFFFYLIKAFQDTILIFLLVAATFMLIVGTLGDPKHGWIEGVAIYFAVIVITLVTAINDYHKELQFVKLQKQIKLSNKFAIVRNGETEEISTKDITVGDLILLKYGDQIPADAIVVSCSDLCVDESSLTGESDLIKKDATYNRFLLSGTNVMKGAGKAIVLAVGINSQSGKIMQMLGVADQKVVKKPKSAPKKKFCLSFSNLASKKRQTKSGNQPQKRLTLEVMGESQDNNPQHDENLQDSIEVGDNEEENKISNKNSSVLQKKLTKLAFIIGKIGLAFGVAITVILIIRFCVVTYSGDHKRPFEKSDIYTLGNFVLVGVSILIVAIPEGLPLAVTLALAFSVYKMLKDNNLVRHLYSCETMGNATTICSDKTGTLTTNRMTVVLAYISQVYYKNISDVGQLSQNYLDILCSNIAINKSFESSVEPSKIAGDLPLQLGNKTECALIGFMISFGKSVAQFECIYTSDKIIKIFPFLSEKKLMTTVVKVVTEDSDTPPFARILTKGAPEYLLSRCSRVISNTDTLETQPLNAEMKTHLKKVLEDMASNGLRTIALAYRDVPIESLGEIESLDDNIIVDDMISLCLVGIEDPVRREVPSAIKACKKSGVVVRMVTGDNIITARSIAIKCGIYDPQSNQLVLDSVKFNRLVRNKEGQIVQSQFDKVWPRLRVLARSSPQDKYVLVNGIIESKRNKNREIVAVTGDGTNDAPALKKADVGFAMGISGTDVAKEAGDIVITDDNFASIVKALMWGRNVYDAISKFIQFQLTVNVVAILICSFTSVMYDETVLKAIQLLWVNLIMDSLASLALATDDPTPDLLDRPPYGRDKSLLSSKMVRFITLHSLYQLTVMLVFIFAVPTWFGIPNGFLLDSFDYIHSSSTVVTSFSQHLTMCFNVFVLMQICNEFNARRVHGERNIFRHMFHNRYFIGIIVVTLAAQFSGYVFKTQALDIDQWLWCIFFATGELLYHQLVISIPPLKVRKKYRLGGEANSLTDMADIDRQLAELDVNAKTLWIRGLFRLRQQLRVIKVFRDLANKSSERLPSNFKVNFQQPHEAVSPSIKPGTPSSHSMISTQRQWSVDYVSKNS